MKRREAQTILAHLEQWAAELAKQIATLPNEIRTCVEKPASDLSLLEGLTACLSGAAAAAPAEDLSTPAPAKVASQAASAPSSGHEDFKDRFTQIAVVAKRRHHVPDDLHASRSKHAPTYVKIKGSHVIDS